MAAWGKARCGTDACGRGGVARPDRAEVVRAAADGVAFGYPLVVSGLLLDALRGGPAAPLRACGLAEAVRDGPDGVGDDPAGVSGWMDLAVEPVVLSVHGAAVDLLDGWTEVFASPAAGSGTAHHVVVGPYWHGTLPPDLDRVRSPTAIAWVTGPHGGAAGDAPGYRLTPLSAWSAAGGTAAGAAGMVSGPAPGGTGGPGRARDTGPPTPPADRVAVMHPRVLFGLLGRLMADNPPPPADDPVVERLAAIGVLTGEDYDWDGLDPQAREDVLRGVWDGLDTVEAHGRAARAAARRGVVGPRPRGGFGGDHAARAGTALAVVGLLRAPAGTGALEP
jgi:Protein of unknown function (DUF1254)